MKPTYFFNSKLFLERWEGRARLKKKKSEDKTEEGRGNDV
jgi:hypothetical protein